MIVVVGLYDVKEDFRFVTTGVEGRSTECNDEGNRRLRRTLWEEREGDWAVLVEGGGGFEFQR